MRQRVIRHLGDWIAYSWRIARQMGRPIEERIILQAPTDAGSLGDQAMLDAASEFLIQRLGMDVIIAARPGHEIRVRSDVAYAFVSLKHLSIPKVADRKAVLAGSLAFLGADVIDGVYAKTDRKLRLLHNAYRAGVRCAALGFSFSETPAKPALERLQSMPGVRMHVRDPISAGRFQTATGLTPIQVADLAFLLRPEIRSDSAHEALRWINDSRNAGRTILAVNAGGPGLWSEKSMTLPQLQVALAEWMAADPKRCVVLVPHDLRQGMNGDEGTLDTLADHLSGFGADRVHLLRAPLDAWDVKALAGHVDFALTARMHFAIACLGMGVPPLCMAYQGKFEGLMQHFGLKDMFVRAGDPLMGQLEAFQTRVPELRKAISKQLPEVTRRSAANFEWLMSPQKPAKDWGVVQPSRLGGTVEQEQRA